MLNSAANGRCSLKGLVPPTHSANAPYIAPLGWLADHSNSRRTPLIIGLLVLIGATALLAIGTSITVLIIGRALQGLSGAVVW